MSTHESQMDTGKLPAGDGPASNDWHKLYESERKKSRILGATTVAASLLAVGIGAWGLSNADSAAMSSPAGGQRAGQFAPPGMPSQDGSGTMPGQMGGQDLASQLFNTDGSVNTEAVEQLLASAPDGADLDQFLQFAVQRGELTQSQADAIAAAVDGTSAQDT